jgi:hypothetical protein
MRPALAVIAVAVLAGCGGSSSSRTTHSQPTPTAPASRTIQSEPTPTAPASHGQPIAPAPGRGVPQPAGPASLSVRPSTVSPGATVVVTLHAPAGTRQATVTVANTVTVSATERGAAFVATVVVPRSLPGGFWPVVARYGTSSLTRSATTQLKVFTP